jgi:hypothetical protein
MRVLSGYGSTNVGRTLHYTKILRCCHVFDHEGLTALLIFTSNLFTTQLEIENFSQELNLILVSGLIHRYSSVRSHGQFKIP